MSSQRNRILLLQPSAPYAPQGFAPLAVATVAGLTPGEFRVDIWDEVALGPVDVDAAVAQGYAIVGISVTFPYQSPRAGQVAREFRERDILTVLGGAFPTSNPSLFRDRADVLIVGESEELWPQFLRDWRARRHKSEYRQILPPDLAHAPPPNWDPLADGFSTHYVRGSVQTTRGCPFDCEFCDVIYIYGRKQRHKAVETVIGEAKRQHELGMSTVFLADDAFEADPAYSTRLMEALIALNRTLEPPMAFEVQCGVNVARSDVFLQLLADSNFELLWMGVESPKPESLISINKMQNVRRDMGGDLRRIAAHGVGVAAYMIVGLDEDDDGIFDQHVQFWTEASILLPIVNILTAVPHTKLWMRLAHEGRLLLTPGAREGIFDLTSNIVPKRMSRKRLVEGYLYLLTRAANWELFAERLRGWVDAVERVPQVPAPRSVDALVEARRGALVGGEGARTHFDELVAYASDKHPSLLPRVLTFLATHDGRSYYFNRYHLPQLRELIQREGSIRQAPRTKWSTPIPEGFRADFRRRILPRVYARVRANLTDQSMLAEALSRIFVDYLIRFGHEYGQFQDVHMKYLDELSDRICAQFNGVAPHKFAAREPDAEDVRGSTLAQMADRLLKSIAEDLISEDSSLHRPERQNVYLG